MLKKILHLLANMINKKIHKMQINNKYNKMNNFLFKMLKVLIKIIIIPLVIILSLINIHLALI